MCVCVCVCVCVYEFLKLQYFRTQSIVLWDPTNPQHLFLPWKGIFAWMYKRRYIPKNQHQQCREPAWGTPPMAKDMRKEASAYAKAGSSLRKPPVPEHLPSKPESTYFTVSCSHLHLWLYGGLSPTGSLGEGVNLQLQSIKIPGCDKGVSGQISLLAD